MPAEYREEVRMFRQFLVFGVQTVHAQGLPSMHWPGGWVLQLYSGVDFLNFHGFV